MEIKSQTLEEIANGLFDELGVQDNDEGTFDRDAYQANATNPDDLGEQEKNTDEAVAKKPDQPEKPAERLYAGRFKTVEEMEKAFLDGAQAQQAQPQPQPAKEEIPDLSRELLITLHEQDDSDGTAFTVEYLQKKMAERDLTDFEIEKLKELDTAGKDLYGSYVSIKTKREVMAEIQPTLKPIQEQQNKEQFNAFVEREKAIFSSLESEFGKDELAALKSKTSDPKFNQTVLDQSDIGRIIANEFANGSKATAYKMLLRESKSYLAKQQETIKQDKKTKSFPADVGAKADPMKKKTASTVEEAFNDSLQELNY